MTRTMSSASRPLRRSRKSATKRATNLAATSLLAAAALAATTAAARPVPLPAADPSTGRPLDAVYLPDPAVLAARTSPTGRTGRTGRTGWHPPLAADTGATMGAVEQRGEIAILEGDSSILTGDGSGGWAIAYDTTTQNPIDIAQRFYTTFPDAFDELVVFTTFTDEGTPGAAAYELFVANEVEHIGLPVQSDAALFGASRGVLRAFVDMKGVDQFPRFDGLPVTDGTSMLYPVLAQEFGHRWLARLKYRDASGAASTAMLGRDGSHWATTMETGASVFDGMRFADRGDGSFVVVEEDARYSPLDLYAMGLVAPSEVPDWFRIDGATLPSGAAADSTRLWALGQVLRGARETITMQQVLGAMGPRVPDAASSPRAFRVAFVLVTRPGERAADVTAAADTLETVRHVWEQQFAAMTGGRATVCTQLSTACGAPEARITAGSLVEGPGGNGDGVIEPGEPVVARFTVENDAAVAAAPVAFTVAASGAGAALPQLTQSLGAPASIDLPAHASATVVAEGTVPPGADLCSGLLTVDLTAHVGPSSGDGGAGLADGTFRGFASALVGRRDVRRDDFDADAGLWSANLDGSDTAPAGSGFTFGHPLAWGFGRFFTFQPDGGDGGSAGAWFTDPARGVRGGDSHALGVGRSTLWSPWIDLAGTRKPVLGYAAWLVALDLSQKGRLQTADEDHLLLEATNDGALWVRLDQVDGADDRWRPRTVELATFAGTGQGMLALDRPLRFRFTVNRDGAAELVEAGVDSFRISSETAACGPLLGGGGDGGASDGGGAPRPASGCRVGAPGHGSDGGDAPTALALAAIALALTRRRR